MAISLPRIKTSWFLITAIVFFISTLPALSRERFARFTSTVHHVRIPLPHDWLVVKGNGDHLFTALSAKDQKKINFNVYVTAVQEPQKGGPIKPSFNIFTLTESDLFKKMLTSKNAAHGKTLVCHQDAVWLQQTVAAETGYISMYQLLTMHDKKVFTITFTAAGDSHAEALALLRRNMNAIRHVREGTVFTDMPLLQRTEDVIVFWFFFAAAAAVFLGIRFFAVRKELSMPLAVAAAGAVTGIIAVILLSLRLFKDHHITIAAIFVAGIFLLGEFSRIMIEPEKPKTAKKKN